MHVLAEALRVLKPGQVVRIHTMSGKLRQWEDNMRGAGFEILSRETRGVYLSYVVGRKPPE